uniref:Uncharacterized protein n=1 Tax=Cucumis melo TaxID=3656 RepID=A0A9I9DR05_CUCME
MKKCCQNMKGVISAEIDKEVPELITVKGVFEVKKLLAHIRKGVEKIVTVIKEEPATAGSSTAVGGEEQREAAGEGSSRGANHEIEEAEEEKEEDDDGDGEIRVIYNP